MTWGVRLRWVPANVGLGLMSHFQRDGVLFVLIVGPFALFMGKNP